LALLARMIARGVVAAEVPPPSGDAGGEAAGA
jgi:hypothetical protein